LPFLWNTISIGFERQPAFLRDAERDGLVFLRVVEKREEDVMMWSNDLRTKFVFETETTDSSAFHPIARKLRTMWTPVRLKMTLLG